jgi:hypothetical protein
MSRREQTTSGRSEAKTLSTEIASVLESYIREGERSLAELESSKMSVKNVGRDVAEDMLSEMAGAMVSGLTELPIAGRYAKKYSRRILNAKQKSQLQTIERNFLDKSSLWLDSIKRFLSSVSVRKANLKPPGNSHVLIAKFDNIYRSAKPETRIKSAMSILQAITNLPLIYNKDIPQIMEERKPKREDSYEMLKRLETKLRECIQTSLQKASRNWWKERIPRDVQERARIRKEGNEKQWPWHADKDLPLIFYVDFTDYAKIIVTKDNWEQVFKQIFREKDIILAKLKELEPVRNAIAHVRDLSHTQLQKLKLYSEDIISCIQEA